MGEAVKGGRVGKLGIYCLGGRDGSRWPPQELARMDKAGGAATVAGA